MRWWATLRGQTLGRTLFGLMEMREALVDVAYLELKALHQHSFLDMDYYSPNARSQADDVLAWLQRNRLELFRSTSLDMSPMLRRRRRSGRFHRDSTAFVNKDAALGAVVCAELAMGCFLELLEAGPPPGLVCRTPYGQLVARDADGRFVLPDLIWARAEPHMGAVEEGLGQQAASDLVLSLDRFREALEVLEVVNELRLKAEQIVQVLTPGAPSSTAAARRPLRAGGLPSRPPPPPPPPAGGPDLQNPGPWDPWLPAVKNSRLFAQRTVRPHKSQQKSRHNL